MPKQPQCADKGILDQVYFNDDPTLTMETIGNEDVTSFTVCRARPRRVLADVALQPEEVLEFLRWVWQDCLQSAEHPRVTP